MFNKRDQIDTDKPERPNPPATQTTETAPAVAPRGSTSTATIGASVHIKGEVHGEENLIIEGQVSGVVKLKSHTLTIGQSGKVEAEIFAHSVQIDGVVLGDVLASERIIIRKSASIQGNIIAPRISLEDGAKFRGSIDMDTESERFRKAFSQPASISSASKSTKPEKPAIDADKPQSGNEIKAAPKVNGKVGDAA